MSKEKECCQYIDDSLTIGVTWVLVYCKCLHKRSAFGTPAIHVLVLCLDVTVFCNVLGVLFCNLGFQFTLFLLSLSITQLSSMNTQLISNGFKGRSVGDVRISGET